MKTRKKLSPIWPALPLVLLSQLTLAVSVDETPPAWQNLQWVHGAPQTLEELRGRVVLVRWWTAPQCPFCKASSVALNQWHAELEAAGLTVVGIYHHKLSSPLDPDDVGKYATALGFEFPIAIDQGWQNLRAWWLDQHRDYTSVSFLIGRGGKIRHIHPGGDYVAGEVEYDEMDGAIRRLLTEPVGVD